MACNDAHHGTIWTSWDALIRQRDAHALSEWSRKLAPELKAFKYRQFEFFQQWEHLKTYCQQRGIRFMGDMGKMGGDCTIPTVGLRTCHADTDVPAGCVRLQFVLPFSDSRRQKAEFPAVCVKAGQRPPRSGRRALTQTVPRLH